MVNSERIDGRKYDEIRSTSIQRDFLKYPEGSVLITQGNTKVIVTASVLDYVPRFLQDTGSGWITADYNMLPRSTQTRMNRERNRLRTKGRTHEIQRLIGRSIRAAFDYKKLGERTIKIDCDVIQADGGTRCASITGAFVAVFDAIRYMYDEQMIYNFPDYQVTAAISLGIRDDNILLDLNYAEDSTVDVDVNIVMNENLEFIEIQGTAEGETFSKSQLVELLDLSEKGISDLIKLQQKELNL
ncbi:MAG: ribonuclease PH [Candidatus Lokiarchaeota archaeon]|nr:ribonuclease PH [Candidatus Lokiarchaeota archaeon]MBD3202347.1 ribonuclease PH [Candidatus Lokiarchaeota archaeon]